MSASFFTSDPVPFVTGPDEHHDRDEFEGEGYHAHVAARYSIPLNDQPVTVGHGVAGRWVVASGGHLYVIHTHRVGTP